MKRKNFLRANPKYCRDKWRRTIETLKPTPQDVRRMLSRNINISISGFRTPLKDVVKEKIALLECTYTFNLYKNSDMLIVACSDQVSQKVKFAKRYGITVVDGRLFDKCFVSLIGRKMWRKNLGFALR